MGKAVSITSSASDNAVVVASGSQYRGAGSIGGNATITNKALDLTNANTGNITFGETGLGDTFAQTVKDLNKQTTNALSGFAATLSDAIRGPAGGMPSGDDLETTSGGGLASLIETVKLNPLPWVGGLVATVALGLWLKSRRK